MSPTNLGKMDAEIKGLDVDLDAVEDDVTAIKAALAAGGGSTVGGAGYTFGTTFPAPTLGSPLFFNTSDHKLYVPGGDAWYVSGTGVAATGTGAANAPTNLTAVVNSDNTVSLAWTLPAGTITAVTVREKFASPSGVSGMPLSGSATTNTRPASSVASTREYYVTCTIGGVESAESNHVTVTLPYGSTPTGSGGGVVGGGGSTGTTPAALLGLGGTGGYWNLGVGRPTGHEDIAPSVLYAGYVESGYLYMNAANTGVTFRQHMDGKTTSTNTHYARTELREYTPTGAKAAWSVGTSGSHVMTYEFSCGHIPPNKPWVTVGQIHDASSDAVSIKLKGTDRTSLDLVATIYDTDHATKLATGYNATLGDSATHLTVKIEVVNGSLKIYCNNVLKITSSALSGKGTGQYFKLGSYGQTHFDWGGFESPSEYTDITVYSLAVTHSSYS